MSKDHNAANHSRATHKDRAVWFQRNAAFPMRDASPVELEKFWASQLQADIDPAHRWECIGPNNIAGRVTSLAIHPNNPHQWFAGSATGGVWVTNDAGESWSPTWSRFANQNIGALGVERDSQNRRRLNSAEHCRQLRPLRHFTPSRLVRSSNVANCAENAFPGGR